MPWSIRVIRDRSVFSAIISPKRSASLSDTWPVEYPVCFCMVSMTPALPSTLA